MPKLALRKFSTASLSRAELIAAGPQSLPPVPLPEMPPADATPDGEVCTDPACQHLAAEHEDTTSGPNMGACAAEGCMCLAMKQEVEQEPPAAEVPPVVAASILEDDPAEEAAEVAEEALNAPPEGTGDEDNMGPAFTIPVLVIEGQPTGDGREIAVEALDWRVPPIPLMFLATETHDPSGMSMNDPAVMCGRIDELERRPGDGGTFVIWAKGYYFATEEGLAAAAVTDAMGRCGISADIAVEDSIMEFDEEGMLKADVVMEGRLMGATQCPYPAFEGAYIVLGDGEETPEATAIPQATEGPLTPAEPPPIIQAGGQLIHLMAMSECRACDEGERFAPLVASGAPTRPPADWFTDPGFAVGDGRLVEILGRNDRPVPGGKYACPITVTEEGRVYGHIAPWETCHTGKPGQCVTAPRSAADYAHFLKGQLRTATGELVKVGVLTADTNHAPLRLTPATAQAHYDNTGSICADVTCGEDEFGIWVAGALRPDATEGQIRNLMAGSLSGDWREVSGQLELVAALAVPVPGFPLVQISHRDGERRAIVASGALTMQRMKDRQPGRSGDALTAALAPLLPLAKGEAVRSISDSLGWRLKTGTGESSI